MSDNILVSEHKNAVIFKLDSYLLMNILRFLSLSEIENFYQSKPSLFMKSNINLWEHIVKEKKLHYFLGTSPTFNMEQQCQEYAQQCSLKPVAENLTSINFTRVDSIEEHFLPTIINMGSLNEQVGITKNWRQVFKQYYNKILFDGDYLGDYESHGTETLRAYQFGYFVFFVKIIGDPNIPEGKITFYMRLTSDLLQGIGYIQLADTGYINPKWGQAAIQIKKKKKNPLNMDLEIEKSETHHHHHHHHTQIKVDWYIQQQLLISFTQKIRFAIWKEGYHFNIKNKQKFLNIKYDNLRLGGNVQFTSREGTTSLNINNPNNSNNNNN